MKNRSPAVAVWACGVACAYMSLACANVMAPSGTPGAGGGAPLGTGGDVGGGAGGSGGSIGLGGFGGSLQTGVCVNLQCQQDT